MPHVITHVARGTSEQQKQKLAQEFSKAVAKDFGVLEENISVAVEEVAWKNPNVIVVLWPGRTDEQKHQLTKDFTKAAAKTLRIKADAFSIGFKEIAPEEWIEKIYKPEIVGKADKIYKRQSYDEKIYNSWLNK